MTYEERPNGMMLGTLGHTIRGRMLQVGDIAPDFQLESSRNHATKTLQDYGDKIKVISVVPSLPTNVCSAQTRRFNQEAADLSEDVVVLTVSADLPMAQRAWCGAEGIKAVEVLSTHRDMQFADAYGVHDLDWRITQRSVFVLDRHNRVIHAEYMTQIGDEVNFDAAIAAAKQALG
jgi:thiol peroxidase